MWTILIINFLFNSVSTFVFNFGYRISPLNCTKNEGNCENIPDSCKTVKVQAPKFDTSGEYFYMHVSELESMIGNNSWVGESFNIVQEGSQNWIGKIKVWKTDIISLAVGRREYGSAQGQWAVDDIIRLQTCKRDSEIDISTTSADAYNSNKIITNDKTICIPT